MKNLDFNTVLCEKAYENEFQTRKNDITHVIARLQLLNQTEVNDVVTIPFVYLQKNSWQRSTRPINVIYLLARLASKNGKTDIGDTLNTKNNSRMAVTELVEV